MHEDKRLIEDYLPIQAISAEASREKNIRKGHICTLHLWWARRPLVACRAAVYGALVPADQWVRDVDLKNAPSDPAKAEAMKNGAKKGLNRKQAKRFVTDLCKYPGDPRIIEQAQKHILTAHATRLMAELVEGRKTGEMPAWVEEFKFTGQSVTMDDIVAGRAPRPRVLDMFAGGGAIPLEALRLGCEAYALELNPVAHIIELCTLVYPQKYGKPAPDARGMTGPAGKDGKPTWGGLAEEVRYWGNWVLQKVRAEIGDLYPLIPDPAYKGKKEAKDDPALFKTPIKKDDVPPGYLIPVAYLWTRTVKCKNPACGATVPLVKQTWLCKKKGRYAALRMVAPKGKKQVRFEVVEHTKESDFDFDPAGFSSAGNATCPFCGTVADSDYVMREGCEGRSGLQHMAVAAISSGRKGKMYLDSHGERFGATWEAKVHERLFELQHSSGINALSEQIGTLRPSPNARGLSSVTRHGMATFGDLFTERQCLLLTTLTDAVRSASAEMGSVDDRYKAISAYLGLWVSKMSDYSSRFCMWLKETEAVAHMFARHALSMLWDFAEINPFGSAGMNLQAALVAVTSAIEELTFTSYAASVTRGNAMALPYGGMQVDAVITDPPYYDNVPYADISDVFYVWLKRAVGSVFSEHFAAQLSPKRDEVTALASRHKGDATAAYREYEERMFSSLQEASRVLKPGCPIIIVYAHKTTLGWSTLVDALRNADFIVTEAWPLDTERSARLLAQETASLASSIFLVAEKRNSLTGTGNYEDDVRPELDRIVRERVATLWEQGITGADLVIACVGAGLRAFTRYERVEFANGEEVPAERFLTEVETVVLETILAKLSKEVGADGGQYTLSAVDSATRFYILWRYTYRSSELDAGEAIIFANGTHVELEGTSGLCYGNRALLEKKKSKYRLRDYTERGNDEKLGRPGDDGEPAPLVDALHRTLWLMDNRPGELGRFLAEANVNLEQMRLVAQALAGPALKGSGLADVSPAGELGALARLTANWRSLTEGVGLGELFDQKERTR